MPQTISNNTFSKCTSSHVECVCGLTRVKDMHGGGNVIISSIEAGGDEGSSTSVYVTFDWLTTFIEKVPILNWLHRGTPDPSITHNRLRGEHHIGTGEWVLELEVFKRWLETPGSSLWIKGIREQPTQSYRSCTLTLSHLAGNGKSVIWYQTLHLHAAFPETNTLPAALQSSTIFKDAFGDLSFTTTSTSATKRHRFVRILSDLSCTSSYIFSRRFHQLSGSYTSPITAA
jgi:hypothetical protein